MLENDRMFWNLSARFNYRQTDYSDCSTPGQRHAQVLSQLLHGELHWLDVADRIQYKLGATVHRCLHGKASQYLADCCVAVSELAGRQRLRSAQHRQLDVPRYQRSTFGRRAFSVAGPTVWNSLPDELKNATDEAFSRLLKTFLFSQY